MSGLLDFFVLEASEQVEQLDGLVARASGGAPELEPFARAARTLRGSATMAKISGVADVAAGLERVARALRAGSLTWDVAARGAVIAAVDDLKILIHGARNWGAPEQAKAAARTAELTALAPIVTGVSAAPAAGGGTSFLATETREIAAALAQWGSSGAPGATLDATMRRVRALRGIASLRDLPPLTEVVDALDSGVKPLELGSTTASRELTALFATAATVLAHAADAIARGARPAPDAPEVHAFTAAAAALAAAQGDGDQIVPISALFPADGGANELFRAPNPPTTPAQRFSLEVVSQAEHLRRLVSDARAAADPAARERLGRELRTATRAMARAAESFSELAVANFLSELGGEAATLAPNALSLLDQGAALLAAGAPDATARIQALRHAPRASAPTPAPTPIVPIESLAPDAPSAPSGPAGESLHALLSTGLAGLADLESTPLSEPVEVVNDEVVPIEELLYSGRDALERAAELGAALRAAGSTPDPDALAELYDLLALAAAE